MFSKFITRTLGSQNINEDNEDFMTNIPVQVLVFVFSYLTSHQIAAARLVNRKFNKAGKKVLNRRFSFYCSFIPRVLRSALKNRSVFPAGSLREGDLHVLSAALLLLRSIFGRYIITGRCCFYPGLVLDHIESITLSATTKRFKWKLIDAMRMRGRHLYYRSVNKLFLLIETAAEHFERQIEPLLPPPRTFIGTKVLDLIASTSELQCEENISVFCQRVADHFPKNYPCNLNTHAWLARLRSDIIHKNIEWIFKASRLSQREITSSRMKLRWYSSQSDYYKSNINLKSNVLEPVEECTETPKLPHEETNFLEDDKFNENLMSYFAVPPNPTVTENQDDSIEDDDDGDGDGDGDGDDEDDDDNVEDYNNDLMNTIIIEDNKKHNCKDKRKSSTPVNKCRSRRQKKRMPCNEREPFTIGDCQYSNSLNSTESQGDVQPPYQADINLIKSLIAHNSSLNTNQIPQKNLFNIKDQGNEFKRPNCYFSRDSKTKKMLAETEALLNTTRELASRSKNAIQHSATNQSNLQFMPSYNNLPGHYDLEMLVEDEQNNTEQSEDIESLFGSECTDKYNIKTMQRRCPKKTDDGYRKSRIYSERKNKKHQNAS